MIRVIKRTLTRWLTGRRLWNGNRTTFRRAFLSRDSVSWWAATTWRDKRETYAELFSGPDWDHLDVFRIQSTEMTELDDRR